MTFDELLDQACKSAHLPSEARAQLPNALSNKTKDMVRTMSPEEFGRILAEAIDKINHGSIVSVDDLVRRRVEG